MNWGPWAESNNEAYNGGAETLDAPTNVVLANTVGGFQISWDAVADATGYQVGVKKIGDSFYPLVHQIGNVLSYFWAQDDDAENPLEGGYTYKAEVRALQEL